MRIKNIGWSPMQKVLKLKFINSLMKLFKSFMLTAITVSSTFITIEPTKSQEKIEVTPLIQSTKGLSGKKISYPKWKQAELRLLKVNIPIGLKTPLHIHPSPMLVYVQQGKLKHSRGKTINYFRAGESFIESNSGSPHFVESVGKKPAVLFVGVSSAVDLPTTINK
tara:strand:+ start:129 stop:626 length:498 start_codon:yes stop_codon:yes gene_type:complete